MATLSKNGTELARVEKTIEHESAEGYDEKTTKIIISFRSTGMIMQRRVVTCANGHKPASPWRRWKQYKKGTDVSAKVEEQVAKLVQRGWTKK